jgi:glycosyl transferase family 25
MTPVYLINLDRSTDRLARVTEDFRRAGLEFHRLRAVDGASMAGEEWSLRYDAERNRRDYLAPLSRGEIACILSHRAAWRHLLEAEDSEHAIILEDDIRLLTTADEVQSFAARVCASHLPVLCKLNSLRRKSRRRGTPAAHAAFLPALTTSAQALNRSAARALLAFTETFHEPLDVALQRWWDHGVSMRQATPPLFAETREEGYSSTIRTRSDRPPEGRLLRELRRPVFQLRRVMRACSATISFSSHVPRRAGDE